MNYKGMKILVVGLGKSGIAALDFFKKRGAVVTITDTRPKSDVMPDTDLTGIDHHFGANPKKIFVDKDMIIVSPGVPFDSEGIVAAKKAGVPVVCEMEIGLKEIGGKVIAITGTNGKSTTTTLIGEFLKKRGKNVWAGGNLGQPLLGDIENAKKAEYVVLEVSSYQLEVTPSLKPFAAVWLNCTPDHLDRYDSFESYFMAKALIGRNQTKSDWVIYNSDDSLIARYVINYRSRKIAFSASERLEKGVWYDGDTAKCVHSSSRMDIDVGRTVITGIHNRENIAAAIAVASVTDVGGADIKKVLSTFKGLPHRCQFVRDLNSVRYYNDSKGTNASAAAKSIDGFSSPVILIAGGQDKNTGYHEMRESVKERVKLIVTIGEAAKRIKNELGDLTPVIHENSLEAAVITAKKNAVPGDVVLLSPACASFDMFKNYAHRGEVFTKTVNEL